MADRPAILITRPEDQIEELARAIEAVGAAPVPFPLLRIEPLDPPQGGARLDRPNQYAMAIFVSRNAVIHGARHLFVGGQGVPEGLTVVAVGAGTASELSALDVPVRYPERASSEGVLAMAETQEVAGLEIVIVRGAGGRETMAETLRARGAKVDYLEVYRRDAYPWTPDELASALASNAVELVVITSAETLQHFDRLLSAGDAPVKPALLLSSSRLVELAEELGYPERILGTGAENGKIAASIETWIAARTAPAP